MSSNSCNCHCEDPSMMYCWTIWYYQEHGRFYKCPHIEIDNKWKCISNTLEVAEEKFANLSEAVQVVKLIKDYFRKNHLEYYKICLIKEERDKDGCATGNLVDWIYI